jgi:putative ABC transport system permease protein
MRVLDKKLLRDLRRMWAQALAIALVIAGGVTTLVLSVGAHRSLDETRITYYERYRFADVFAHFRRAPKALVDRIAEIPGVAAVDARITKLALLDLPNFREPATGQIVSLPETGSPTLNQLYLRTGRMPEPGRGDEVVVSESFANAHRFTLGARFSAILNSRKHELSVVGIALSPDFVYAIGPGDRMPDDRRFGIIWMSEKVLASAYDLEGAFSSVSLKLLRNASEREVIQRLDALLDRYGGTAAYGRKDQTSHAFLDHGLDMLSNMTRTLPPIFLLVSAFLVNLTLSRIVALEREQIGLVKAVGYGNAAIVFHYIKFVVVVALIGIAIGGAAGMWLGVNVTRLYGDYYRFPFLVFVQSPDVYATAALLSIGAAILGAIRALQEVVVLPPAVAMQPPAPPTFHRVLPDWLAIGKAVSQPTMMTLRNLVRRPLRAAFTALAMALATGILVVSLFFTPAMEHLIDVSYFMSDRQDATLSFVEKRPQEVVNQVARLPGVIAVEPYREVPARIRYRNIERRVLVSGRPRDADLRRIIDVNLRPVVLPESGLAISDILAKVLGVGAGDFVEIDLLEGQRRTVSLRVAALVGDYFGLQATMDATSLSQLLREAPAVNSVGLSVDPTQLDLLYQTVKSTPTISGMAQQGASLTNFREALAVLITTMGGIYTGLAAVIAFGIVYNSARISLSERARELASLRVLGFTNPEVFRILVLELALLTLLAQPPGWALGYGLAWVMQKNLAGELMRVPLILENLTYVRASAVVITAALASAFIVWERINRLDLVAVLKTRD